MFNWENGACSPLPALALLLSPSPMCQRYFHESHVLCQDQIKLNTIRDAVVIVGEDLSGPE